MTEKSNESYDSANSELLLEKKGTDWYMLPISCLNEFSVIELPGSTIQTAHKLYKFHECLIKNFYFLQLLLTF